jgi:glycosyltransferase involved in cell wall biosynthesis
MKRVLWLASWFPNRLDPLAGDFIERHAEAASLYNDIFVLHVVKDNELNIPGKMLKETKSLKEHCQVAITYYQTGFKRFRWLHVIQSNLRYCRCYYHSIRAYIKERGRPDCIHVHIALKAGLIALLTKKIYGIPYIVSEQWTGLCPEAKPGLDDRNRLFRWFWKMVMRNASSWSAVSEYLGNSIQQKFKLSGFSVIPNIVNSKIFYPEVHLPGPFRFIHVSVMNYQKNPEQIFEAIALLKQKTQDPFIVFLFGELSAALKALAEKLDINDQIAVMSPRPQPILAKDMRSSGALILYSRFETFGCVIIEANACGLPVIVSDIPVLHENVVDGVTGIFVPLDDPGKLADQMAWMMHHAKDFDREKMITLTKEKYSYMRAGEAFDRLYRQLHPGLEN